MTTFTTVTTHNRAMRALTGVALSAALAIGAAACGTDGTDSSAAPVDATTVPGSTASGEGPPEADALVSSVELLSDDERSGLAYMVEEEKLAHDVYLTLGGMWDVPTFTNIVQAESTHMASVQGLLDRYAIPDPTDGLAMGEFADPGLAALYTDLVARGTTSVTEALAVGAVIEEIDIVDLDLRAMQTDEAAIEAVYSNLRSGSENHLRAFARALDSRGVTYDPTHLDQASYDAIVAAGTGQGRSRS